LIFYFVPCHAHVLPCHDFDFREREKTLISTNKKLGAVFIKINIPQFAHNVISRAIILNVQYFKDIDYGTFSK